MRHWIVIIFFFNFYSFSQKTESRGYSAFQKQDKSFITSNLRGKHAVSFGIYNSNNAPFNNNLISLFGLHLGYNYLILSKKEKYKKKKNITKSRTIINSYIGLHFDYSTKNEFLINLKFYHPLIKAKGLIFTWLFINEIGLGIHHLPNYLNPSGITNPNFSLEILRLKINRIPLFLTASSNYDLRNNFSVPEPKNIEFMLSIKYYFFKNKIN
jgi:hypothetical protein